MEGMKEGNNCTEDVNLMKFPQAVYKISCLTNFWYTDHVHNDRCCMNGHADNPKTECLQHDSNSDGGIKTANKTGNAEAMTDHCNETVL